MMGRMIGLSVALLALLGCSSSSNPTGDVDAEPIVEATVEPTAPPSDAIAKVTFYVPGMNQKLQIL